MLSVCNLYSGSSQQARYVEPMLVYYWAIVCDAGPTLNQHLFNVPCLLGVNTMYAYWQGIFMFEKVTCVLSKICLNCKIFHYYLIDIEVKMK